MKKAASFSSLSLDALFFSYPHCMCHLDSLSLLALKTFGLLRLRMCAQRACLAERELVTGPLAGLDALSARRDKSFAGRVGCVLSALLSNLTFFWVFLSLSDLASSLSGLASLSQSGSLSEPFSNISKSSLLQPKNPNNFNIRHLNGASIV